MPRPSYCLDYGVSLTASGGLAPYSFVVTAGSLPPGLALGVDGRLAGVASTPGAYGFTVRATDADGCSGSASYLVPIAKGFRAGDDQVELVLPASGTGGSGDPLLDTVTSSLVVSGIATQGVAVTNLEVHVTLLHERAGDLVLTLLAPDGTRIALADRRGGVGQDYLGTVFSDTGTEGVCDGAPPFTGSHRPEESLGLRPANGTWTLEIVDAAAGSTGLLVDWSLDVRTASAGQPFNLSVPVAWQQFHPLDVGQVALDAEHLYVTAANTVTRIEKYRPYSASNWVRTFSPGSVARGPLVVERSFSTPLLVANVSGFAYGLSVDDGTTLWSRDLRRPSCTTDTLSTAAADQLWNRSDCAFRTAIPGDLVFFGTRTGCTTGGTANRVIALDPASGNVRWTFNTTGSQQMDRVTGLVVDPVRNRLFVATEKADPQHSIGTVWALDTRTGARAWSVDAQAVRAAPILADGLFVLSSSGELHKLDPDSGATTWSLTLADGTRSFDHDMAFDPLRRLLFAVDSFGMLHAVEDLGTSAASAWSLATLGDLEEVAVTPTQGWVYASSRHGRVHQIGALTGTTDRFRQVGAFQPGAAPRLLVDATVGGGFVEARLMLVRADHVVRARVPWFSSDSTQVGSEDNPASPYAHLSLLGHTAPGNVPMGEVVTDTLTVTNRYNHVPECVVVQATLPARASLVNATVPGGTASQVGDQLVARLGRVEIGESVVLTLTLRPGRGGPFVRTYTATSELPPESPIVPSVTLENEVWKVRPR